MTTPRTIEQQLAAMGVTTPEQMEDARAGALSGIRAAVEAEKRAREALRGTSALAEVAESMPYKRSR